MDGGWFGAALKAPRRRFPTQVLTRSGARVFLNKGRAAFVPLTLSTDPGHARIRAHSSKTVFRRRRGPGFTGKSGPSSLSFSSDVRAYGSIMIGQCLCILRKAGIEGPMRTGPMP